MVNHQQSRKGAGEKKKRKTLEGSKKGEKKKDFIVTERQVTENFGKNQAKKGKGEKKDDPLARKSRLDIPR